MATNRPKTGTVADDCECPTCQNPIIAAFHDLVAHHQTDRSYDEVQERIRRLRDLGYAVRPVRPRKGGDS